MVFEKITIFEPHLEGATLGPTFGESDEQEHVQADEAHSEDSGGRRILVPVLGFLAVAAVATVLARRFFGDADDEFEQVDLEESVDETMEETVE